MARTAFLLRFEVAGNPEAAERAIDKLLDAGVLQDAIEEYECDEGDLTVVSALCTGSEHIDDDHDAEEIEDGDPEEP
jgi:hypothetical protein